MGLQDCRSQPRPQQHALICTVWFMTLQGVPGSSAGEESTCNADSLLSEAPGKSKNTGVGCHGAQIAYDVNGIEVLSEIYWYLVPSNLFSLLVPQCDDFLHW